MTCKTTRIELVCSTENHVSTQWKGLGIPEGFFCHLSSRTAFSMPYLAAQDLPFLTKVVAATFSFVSQHPIDTLSAHLVTTPSSPASKRPVSAVGVPSYLLCQFSKEHTTKNACYGPKPIMELILRPLTSLLLITFVMCVTTCLQFWRRCF